MLSLDARHSVAVMDLDNRCRPGTVQMMKPVLFEPGLAGATGLRSS